MEIVNPNSLKRVEPENNKKLQLGSKTPSQCLWHIFLFFFLTLNLALAENTISK